MHLVLCLKLSNQKYSKTVVSLVFLLLLAGCEAPFVDALDLGSGLGRVSKSVLLPAVTGRVTLVDQSATWMDG